MGFRSFCSILVAALAFTTSVCGALITSNSHHLQKRQNASLSTLLTTTTSTSLSATPRPLAPNEPPDDGSLLFSVFLDTTIDTPTNYTRRTSNIPSSYHFTITLPITDLPPLHLVDATRTNTAIYLSITPILPMSDITDLHISALLLTCFSINRHGRRVFLRPFPSMNTPFVEYGQRPSPFDSYGDASGMPFVILMGLVSRLEWEWGKRCPQVGLGYPWIGEFSARREVIGEVEWGALDTDGDGELTVLDDPYAPYYPGDDVVDWVGASIYHYPNTTDIPEYLNTIPPPGHFESILNGTPEPIAPGVPPPPQYPNLYTTYSASRNKPFMISETNAIYVFNATPYSPPISTPPLPLTPLTPLQVKQTWWRQFMTNKTFLNDRPLLKMVCLFEYVVESPAGGEVGYWRDYSTSRDVNSDQRDVVRALREDLEEFGVVVGGGGTGLRWDDADTKTDESAPRGVATPPLKPDASRLVLWGLVAVPVFVSIVWGVASVLWRRRRRRKQVALYVRKEEEEEGREPGIEDLDEEERIVVDPFGEREERERGEEWRTAEGVRSDEEMNGEVGTISRLIRNWTLGRVGRTGDPDAVRAATLPNPRELPSRDFQASMRSLSAVTLVQPASAVVSTTMANDTLARGGRTALSLPRVGNQRHVATVEEREHERRGGRVAGRVVNVGL
ncbi:hypothetical protein BC829DRAFT_421588 [Chytridium lagenaria]|nr:hypothetical protein BC829DRAFT_421588 [Chytridium lagenaria]